MYLIFDTSAIDKPRDKEAPYSDSFAWPRMIHLSWIILDKDLKPIQDLDYVITPEGYTLNPTIEKHVRLDKERVEAKGVPIEKALIAFNQSLELVDYVIAHNLNFNQNILAASYHRATKEHTLFDKTSICLMQESTFYCKIPTKNGGYKWPTITELHSIIFSKAYSPANNARADVIAATRCFKALMMGKQLDDLF